MNNGVWVIAAAAVALAGCSVNDHGVVEHETIRADGAIVHRLSAPGVHIETRGAELSFTLGFFAGIQILPQACNGAQGDASAESAAIFSRVRPELSISRILGLQFTIGAGELGVTVGMRERVTLLSLDSRQSFARQLQFDVGDMRATYLRVWGGDTCG